MSRKTIARRYNVSTYNQAERDEMVMHLIAKTQPQRRIFLGKIDNSDSKEERKIQQKALKAYLKGQLFYFHGTTEIEIKREIYNRETKAKETSGTGVFQKVPKPNRVKQMYFFN